MKGARLKSAIGIQLKSLRDLGRLAAALSYKPHSETPVVYRFKLRESEYLAVLYFTPGYYDLSALPILYYYKLKDGEIEDEPFIAYKIDEEGEDIKLTRAYTAGYRLFPILRLEEPLHPIIREAIEGRRRE
ncbi:MAG: hypothetical protein DRN96_05440 [Thermoproteota archaeon]|nr:MAG: hypothetical protein DRN96_05440 [Candidatus Korarchaeota archaeon]